MNHHVGEILWLDEGWDEGVAILSQRAEEGEICSGAVALAVGAELRPDLPPQFTRIKISGGGFGFSSVGVAIPAISQFDIVILMEGVIGDAYSRGSVWGAPAVGATSLRNCVRADSRPSVASRASWASRVRLSSRSASSASERSVRRWTFFCA